MRDGLVDNARHQRADGQAQLDRADEEATQGGGGDLGLVRGHPLFSVDSVQVVAAQVAAITTEDAEV